VGIELERFLGSLVNVSDQGMYQTYPIARLTLQNVLVTPALRQWQSYQTLAATYRDAYYSQLNTRYEAQHAEYTKLAAQAESTCLDVGVGIVYDPLPAPAAPVVRTGSDAGSGGGWFLRVTWTGANGAESAPGAMVQYPVQAGETLSVEAVKAPANATGWNLYAGQDESALGLQNDSPVALELTWVLLPSGFRTGRPIGCGQKPDQLLTRRRILRRG